MKDLDLSVFPKTEKSEWLQLAKDQLKGEDPSAKLNWVSHGLTELAPYYDSSDIDHLNHLKEFFQSVPTHQWKLYERIKVENVNQSNEKALAALMGGCDGIIFQIPEGIDVTGLLKGIDSSICDVSVVSSGEIDSTDFSGMIQTTSSGNALNATEPFKAPADQLASILQQLSDEKFVQRTTFSDFFLEIATVRALRYLLEKNNNRSDVLIHSMVPHHESDEHQWFLNTTAGLAAILGGSHSIEMPTAVGDSRITRNVGNLIREESKIVTYEDQCGGSYLVEVLTDKIISEAQKQLSNG